SDHHPMEPTRPTRFAPVRLGVNVWVGRSATILPGVTIGDHAVIAAGSIVTGDVPAKTLVAGVPARPIRTLDIPDGWRRWAIAQRQTTRLKRCGRAPLACQQARGRSGVSWARWGQNSALWRI